MIIINLGKVLLHGVIAGILAGLILTAIISIFSLVPILNIFTIVFLPFAWLLVTVVTPALVLHSYCNSLDKGDGVALGAVTGLTLAVVFGITMSIATIIVTGINIGIQGRTEANVVDTGLAALGFLFYIFIGFIGAIPSTIVGGISGWFFENRWRIEKVEVVHKNKNEVN